MKQSHFLYSRLHFLVRNPTAAPKPHRTFWSGSVNSLYRQISRSHPKTSALPILDGWVGEGRTVDKGDLVSFIKALRHHKHYTHALEVSMWMSDKRYIPLRPSDVAIRLDLIVKVHGIEQAENYFDNLPKQLKTLEVYCTFLNCYAQARQLDKAEATMQKMRDLGFLRTWSYNVALNLYYKTGNCDKFDSLITEMEENGIRFDKFTYGIRLSAAAAASDLEGLDKILAERLSDSNSILDWLDYTIAANGYTKAGAVDKAFSLLKRAEGLIPSSKSRRRAYQYLMTQYAAVGKKDDTLRVWKCYKEQMKVYNSGYQCIMSSLLKFDDIENAEKIFEEWESEHENYDIRIPNILVGAYSRNGLLDKAEAFISRMRLKDEIPNPTAWNYLAKGYLNLGQIDNTFDSIRKAVSASQPGGMWMPDMDVVGACLEYLRTKADIEGTEEFLQLLVDKNIIPVNIQERLLNHIKDENSAAVVGEILMEWDCQNGKKKQVKLQRSDLGTSSFSDVGSNLKIHV